MIRRIPWLILCVLVVPVAALAIDCSSMTTLDATTALDNFNNTNNPISGSSPSGGGTWTDVVITGDSNLQTNGTAVTTTSTAADGSAYHSTIWNNNVAASITLSAKDNATDEDFGIYFGIAGTAGSFTGYRGELRIRPATADEWRIFRVDAGTPTVISSGTFQEGTAGDKIGIVRSGSAIALCWNNGSSWSLIVSMTDGTYTSGGKIGLILTDTSVATTLRGDDLKVMNLSTNRQRCIGCGTDKRVIGDR